MCLVNKGNFYYHHCITANKYPIHCVKSVRIWSYSGLHFSRIFRIRTEYGEILRKMLEK